MDGTSYLGGRALNVHERRFIQTLDRIIQQGVLKWEYINAQWMAEQLEYRSLKLRGGTSNDTE